MGEETEENLDQLIEDNSSVNEAPQMEAAPVKPPVIDEYEIVVDGKPIKANLDKLKQWASMGHGAPTKIGQLNTKIKELEPFQSKFKQYEEIDNYAKTNPDWWKHIETSWQSKNQQVSQTSTPEVDPVIKKELDEFKKFKDEITNEKAATKIKSDDDALNAEIKSIETNYPDLDFVTPDETGKSLQTKILEHAEKEGISNYRAAFRDYFHENLVKSAHEKGKESVLKDRQKKTKLGLISEGNSQQKGLRPTVNLKSKSYDDLMNEGLNEIETA